MQTYEIEYYQMLRITKKTLKILKNQYIACGGSAHVLENKATDISGKKPF
jgi:hypothetical protein